MKWKDAILPKHATHTEQSLFLFSLKSKWSLETFDHRIRNVNPCKTWAVRKMVRFKEVAVSLFLICKLILFQIIISRNQSDMSTWAVKLQASNISHKPRDNSLIHHSHWKSTMSCNLYKP